MKLRLLAHEKTGDLLVIDADDFLKHSNEYISIDSSHKINTLTEASVCAAFEQFLNNNKLQQRIEFDVKE